MADWSRRFDEPIPLPDGDELRTLYDAGRYIEKLPMAKHKRPEWQTAMAMLLSAAEGKLSIMFAEIAIRRAPDSGKGLLAQGGQEVQGGPVTPKRITRVPRAAAP
jgi:hypothetical protein